MLRAELLAWRAGPTLWAAAAAGTTLETPMSRLPSKIVVGTDFSDSSAVALQHAASLAERLQAELHIVHIAKASMTASDLGLDVPQEFEESQQANQRRKRLRTMLSSNLDIHLHLRIGHPVHELLAVVRELQPEMVIVGNHGRGAVMRVIHGSISTELMRICPVPLLIVPSPSRDAAASPSGRSPAR